MRKSSTKTVQKGIRAEEFDRKFDEGEDISEYLDWDKAQVVEAEIQRVNVDLPVPFLKQLDEQAALRGIARQALIKTWLYDRLNPSPRSVH